MTTWTRRLATGPYDLDGSYHITSPANGSITLCRGRWPVGDAVETSDDPAATERCDECVRVDLQHGYAEAIAAARHARGTASYDALFIAAVRLGAQLRRLSGHCPLCPSARPNEPTSPSESAPVGERRAPQLSPRWRPNWARAQRTAPRLPTSTRP